MTVETREQVLTRLANVLVHVNVRLWWEEVMGRLTGPGSPFNEVGAHTRWYAQPPVYAKTEVAMPEQQTESRLKGQNDYWEARRDGIIAFNPYRHDTQAHIDWNVGFLDAQHEDSRCALSREEFTRRRDARDARALDHAESVAGGVLNTTFLIDGHAYEIVLRTPDDLFAKVTREGRGM